MYRILIADDEPLEREGMELIIKTMIDRDIDIIHAENGKEAVQKAIILKPHIALMDIRMPGLDGLQAIRAIKNDHPQIKVVLVTAYEFFEYAKEAVHLGVKDYLVKPTKRKEIVTLLQGLLEEIDQEEALMQVEARKQKKLIQFKELAKTELALRFMSDQQQEEEGILQLAELVEFSFEHCFALVIALQNSSLEVKETEQTIYKELQQQFSSKMNQNLSFVVSPMLNEHMAVFVSTQTKESLASIFNDIKYIAERFIHHLNAKQQIDVFIGVGAMQQHLSGIRRSYFEAVFSSTNVNAEQPICLFEQIQQRITQPVLLAKENHATYVKQAIEKIRQERDHETHSMINRATSFIHKNYNRELTLEEVAEYVHLNPYYFSKVFKQLTGATFIDFLTEVRITQAKKLMEQKELSLKEICYLIGYNDPNYLSRVFKKVVGKTPSEYRQSL